MAALIVPDAERDTQILRGRDAQSAHFVWICRVIEGGTVGEVGAMGLFGVILVFHRVDVSRRQSTGSSGGYGPANPEERCPGYLQRSGAVSAP
ncbi:hypothetical protein ACVBGC_22560, partial [Burkholderia stagnalis]